MSAQELRETGGGWVRLGVKIVRLRRVGGEIVEEDSGGEVGDGRAKLDAVMEAAELLAEQYECDGIELTGQKGWEKMLKPYGYKHKGVVLTKELGD